jgi:hypothetical protein
MTHPGKFAASASLGMSLVLLCQSHACGANGEKPEPVPAAVRIAAGLRQPIAVYNNWSEDVVIPQHIRKLAAQFSRDGTNAVVASLTLPKGDALRVVFQQSADGKPVRSCAGGSAQRYEIRQDLTNPGLPG